MKKLTIPPELLSNHEILTKVVSVDEINSLLESNDITAKGAAQLCPEHALNQLKTEPQCSFNYLLEAQQIYAALDQLWSNYQSTNNRPKIKALAHRGECLLAKAMTNLKEFLFWETQP